MRERQKVEVELGEMENGNMSSLKSLAMINDINTLERARTHTVLCALQQNVPHLFGK